MGLAFSEERLRYLVDILQPERLTRICDIGANPVNAPPYTGLHKAGLCEIAGFEPADEPFQKLVARKTDREIYFKAAIGDGTTGKFNVYRDSGFSSLYNINDKFLQYLGMWWRHTRVVQQEKLVTMRLDDIEGLEDFDLLKIDVQGSEANIFLNAQAKLKNTIAVVTEVSYVPLYLDQPLISDQIQILGKCGFVFHKQLHLNMLPLRGKYLGLIKARRRFLLDQAVDGDAVFIKNLDSLDSYSDEALKHLFILADSVFFSFTLALRIAEFLEERGVVSEEQIMKYIAFLNR